MIRIYIAGSEAGTVFRAVGHAPLPEFLKPYAEADPPVYGSLPCASVSLLFELGLSCARQLDGESEDNYAKRGDAFLYVSAGSSEGRHLIEFLKTGFSGISNTYPKYVRLVER